MHMPQAALPTDSSVVPIDATNIITPTKQNAVATAAAANIIGWTGRIPSNPPTAVITTITTATDKKHANALPVKICVRDTDAICKRSIVPRVRSRTNDTLNPVTHPITPHNIACGNVMSHFERNRRTKSAREPGW